MIIQPVFITVPANGQNSQIVSIQDRDYRKLISLVTRRSVSYDVSIQEEGSNRIIARIPSDYSDNAETFLNEWFSGLNLAITIFNNTGAQINAYVGLKLASLKELGKTSSFQAGSNIPKMRQ